MSYKCQSCGKGQPPRTPQHTIVAQSEVVKYTLPPVERGGVAEIILGKEIKKELKVCPVCWGEHTNKQQDLAPTKLIPQSKLRKIERSIRKRLEREEEEMELEDDFM